MIHTSASFLVYREGQKKHFSEENMNCNLQKQWARKSTVRRDSDTQNTFLFLFSTVHEEMQIFTTLAVISMCFKNM